MSYRHTKETILKEAARLFAEKGYRVVTIRELAAAVRINEASIYNHYESKAEILDTVLTSFERRLRRRLLTKEQVDDCIETDTARELLLRCIPDFEDEEEALFMRQVFRITCMEQFTNKKASGLVVHLLVSERAELMQYVLEQLIQRRQIPDLDTHGCASLWSQSLFTAWILWAQHNVRGQTTQTQANEFQTLADHFADMVIKGRMSPVSGENPTGYAVGISSQPEPVLSLKITNGRQRGEHEELVLTRVFREEAERLCTPEVKARILQGVQKKLEAQKAKEELSADDG